MGMAILTALSFIKNEMSRSDMERVLSLLRNVRLDIYDDSIDAQAMWNKVQEIYGAKTEEQYLMVPKTIGRGTYISIKDITIGDFKTAMGIVKKFSEEGATGTSPTLNAKISRRNVTRIIVPPLGMLPRRLRSWKKYLTKLKMFRKCSLRQTQSLQTIAGTGKFLLL